MSSWTERFHSVVISCGHPGSSAPTYPYRLEKVKFGVPLEEVCKNNNIPGPLLVLILKLNKESPNRRDVFRAPGHQRAMKKLIIFLQAGRLVNVDNYSVYTIASVLKKFLRKIPNGIFGRLGENELFAIIEVDNEAEQTERLHRLFTSLPKYTQHLLVLLFGTFRVIASNAAPAGTGMTSEALGVSVAPSFFQSCVSDGKTARMEDVLKFKVATKIMKHIIDKFATNDLFGRENYEYYARVTGRILKVQDEWICSFQYPPPPRGKIAQQKYALQHSLEAEKTWLQCQCERWGLLAQEESRSTPALLTSSSSAVDNSVLSLGVTPEHTFMESCARLSVSLEGPGLFAMTSSPIPKRNSIRGDEHLMQHRNQYSANDELDDDEENYADDDDDGDVDDDDEDNDNDANAGGNVIANESEIFSSELTNEERFLKMAATLHTPKPKQTISTKKKQFRKETPTISGVNDDEIDDDDDQMTVGNKRRYRQFKKKTTTQTRSLQQHTRRLRAGSKSLDGSERIVEACNKIAIKNATVTAISTTTPNSITSAAAATVATTATAITTSTNSATRACSRCNRGIRHSSSCSLASGGGAAAGAANNGTVSGTNGNNGGMTLDELRAVNRYAESTKSLSYLPQVHERQTARMHTRSEWFLSGGDITLQLPNTCSNCCLLTAAQDDIDDQLHYQQQQKHAVQQQHFLLQTPQYKTFLKPHNYLGGGSTRDIPRNHDGDHVHVDHNEDDDDDEYVRALTGGGGNAFYLFHKQRRQKQQQQQQQQTQHHHQIFIDDMQMDTDEICMLEQQHSQQQRHSMYLPHCLHSTTTADFIDDAAKAAHLTTAPLTLSSFGGSGDQHTSYNVSDIAAKSNSASNAANKKHYYLDTITGSYVASVYDINTIKTNKNSNSNNNHNNSNNNTNNDNNIQHFQYNKENNNSNNNLHINSNVNIETNSNVNTCLTPYNINECQQLSALKMNDIKNSRKFLEPQDEKNCYKQQQQSHQSHHHPHHHHYENKKRNSLDLTSCDGRFIVVETTAALTPCTTTTASTSTASTSTSPTSTLNHTISSYNNIYYNSQKEQHQQYQQKQRKLQTKLTLKQKQKQLQMQLHRKHNSMESLSFYDFNNKTIIDNNSKQKVVATVRPMERIVLSKLTNDHVDNDVSLNEHFNIETSSSLTTKTTLTTSQAKKKLKNFTKLNNSTNFPTQKQFQSPRKQNLLSTTTNVKCKANSICNLSCSISTAVDDDDDNDVDVAINDDYNEIVQIKNLRSTNVIAPSEEVDYVLTSHYRHSTPLSQRRNRLQRRRQRLPMPASNSDSLSSTLSSARAGSHAAAPVPAGDTDSTAGSTTSGNNNFVTVIFNVLDFLF